MNSFYFEHLPMSFAETWISKEREILMVYYVILMISTYLLTEWNLKKKRLPFFTFPAAWNNAPGGKLNPRQHLYLKELKNQEQRSKQQHK
jgi:hypothetical protein